MGTMGGRQPAAERALAKFAGGFSSETTVQKHCCWGALFCRGCSEIPSYILLAFAKRASGKCLFFFFFFALLLSFFFPVPFTRLYLSF